LNTNESWTFPKSHYNPAAIVAYENDNKLYNSFTKEKIGDLSVIFNAVYHINGTANSTIYAICSMVDVTRFLMCGVEGHTFFNNSSTTNLCGFIAINNSSPYHYQGYNFLHGFHVYPTVIQGNPSITLMSPLLERLFAYGKCWYNTVKEYAYSAINVNPCNYYYLDGTILFCTEPGVTIPLNTLTEINSGIVTYLYHGIITFLKYIAYNTTTASYPSVIAYKQKMYIKGVEVSQGRTWANDNMLPRTTSDSMKFFMRTGQTINLEVEEITLSDTLDDGDLVLAPNVSPYALERTPIAYRGLDRCLTFYGTVIDFNSTDIDANAYLSITRTMNTIRRTKTQCLHENMMVSYPQTGSDAASFWFNHIDGTFGLKIPNVRMTNLSNCNAGYLTDGDVNNVKYNCYPVSLDADIECDDLNINLNNFFAVGKKVMAKEEYNNNNTIGYGGRCIFVKSNESDIKEIHWFGRTTSAHLIFP
jgi:hypothetical protein